MLCFKYAFHCLILVSSLACGLHTGAQTTDTNPTQSIDDILNSGTNFGNKAYDGLLSGDRGVIRKDTTEGNLVTTAITGLSSECVSRLERVLGIFGESTIASKFHGYGWGNVQVVDLKLPLASLGADIQSNYYGSSFTIPNVKIKPEFDAECHIGTITYTGTNRKYLASIVSDTKVRSSLKLDSHLLESYENKVVGLAKLSDICHETISLTETKSICSSESLEIFCQDDQCYSEPLLYLVERGKIRSAGMTKGIQKQILEAEQYIKDRRQKDSQKANQVQG